MMLFSLRYTKFGITTKLFLFILTIQYGSKNQWTIPKMKHSLNNNLCYGTEQGKLRETIPRHGVFELEKSNLSMTWDMPLNKVNLCKPPGAPREDPPGQRQLGPWARQPQENDKHPSAQATHASFHRLWEHKVYLAWSSSGVLPTMGIWNLVEDTHSDISLATVLGRL